jgi:hypothetical protein
MFDPPPQVKDFNWIWQKWFFLIFEWARIFTGNGTQIQTPTETTTNLEDVGHAINTSEYKIVGSMVFNATTNKPVWSAGNADADVWVDATGSTAHPPA